MPENKEPPRNSNRTSVPDVIKEEYLELLRAVFTYAGSTIRVPLLLNGAAAIALLAFMGNLAAKPEIHGNLLKGLVLPIGLFLCGAAVGGAVSIVAYFIQLQFVREYRAKVLLGGDTTDDGHKVPSIYLFATMLCVATSYVLFILGGVLAALAIA